MNTRKKAILAATIEQYIQTAEPVSSKQLAEGHGLSVSPATVRNELNELEQDGFLSHVHTSSGRIPTDKGYRLYVDDLMTYRDFPAEKQALVLQEMNTIGRSVEQVLVHVADVMSHIMDYSTLVLTPDIYQETLKVAHLILVDLDRILVVLLSSLGVNEEFVVSFQDRVSQDDLNKLSQFLTRKLEGKPLRAIDDTLLGALVAELPQLSHVLEAILKELNRMGKKEQPAKKMLAKGLSKLVRLPEFQNIELTQKVLTALEENKLLLALLNERLSKTPTHQVLIGKETEAEDLEACSIILSPVTVGQEAIGAIGILGPKRMAYPTIIPMVQHIAGMVTHHLTSSTRRSL
ncbi:MAG: heat-inducible transcriptional repressor HrcA [Candidatus Margulisiibacteriota bacterium]